MEYSKKFKAELKELKNVQSFINKHLKTRNVDMKTYNQIHLAVEEIFVNIVQYAYKDKVGICTITIDDNEDNIDFVFEDNGIKFNPLEKELPDVTLPSDKRKIGGLGIFLIEKTMDKIEYNYENGKNILKISKKL